MRRVLVIGIPGAGKSTFARALAAKTGLPLIHLDEKFWRPGWTLTPRSEWRARVVELGRGRALDHGRQLREQPRPAPAACGSVLWFDYPTFKCLRRVLWRVASTYGQVRPDMAPGCPERFDWEFLRYVWRFNQDERPKTVAALAESGRHLDPVVFRRDGEVTQFLDGLS